MFDKLKFKDLTVEKNTIEHTIHVSWTILTLIIVGSTTSAPGLYWWLHLENWIFFVVGSIISASTAYFRNKIGKKESEKSNIQKRKEELREKRRFTEEKLTECTKITPKKDGTMEIEKWGEEFTI